MRVPHRFLFGAVALTALGARPHARPADEAVKIGMVYRVTAVGAEPVSFRATGRILWRVVDRRTVRADTGPVLTPSEFRGPVTNGDDYAFESADHREIRVEARLFVQADTSRQIARQGRRVVFAGRELVELLPPAIRPTD